MNLSFREKSLWASLIAILVVFSPYFAINFSHLLTGDPEISDTFVAIGTFVAAVLFLVVIMVVLHILIALSTRYEDEDERDRFIELTATRNAHWVLSVGVWVTLAAPGASAIGWLPPMSTLLFAHLIFAAFVLAEVVGIVSQLIQYRRGA